MATIFIWLGSGFAFAVGVCCGAWLMRIAWNSSKEEKPAVDAGINALVERNRITWDQVEALQRIADAIEKALSTPAGKQ